MIVVEHGARYTGKIVDVTVTRMHQTVAGKMVFGQVREAQQQNTSQQRPAAAHHAGQEAPKQKLQERLRTRPNAPQKPAPAPAKVVPAVKPAMSAADAKNLLGTNPSTSRRSTRLMQ